jgi:hypothetical protein
MDWKQAKTLLILLLLALNLFLGGSLLYGRFSGNGTAAYTAHAEGILQERDITMTGEWPVAPAEAGMIQFNNEMPVLGSLLESLLPDASVSQAEDGTRTYRAGSRVMTVASEANGNPVVSYRDEQAGYRLDVSGEASLDRELKAFLRTIGFGSYRLVQDREIPSADGVWVTYVQPYKGGRIFDNAVRIRLENGGVAALDIVFHPVRQMMSPIGGGTGAILTAQQALILSPLRGPITFTEILFGWGQGDAGELYYSPMWRLMTQDGREIRLDAYTGVLLSR